MSASPNKLSRLWHELRRRRVIHVITVYASAAFVLIELVNNLTGPLNLPPNLFTIVIIILAAGFLLAVILSWIYDLSGEGFERTKPIQEVTDEQAAKVPNNWKIATYVGFAVIIGLVTFNIVGGSKLLRAGDIPSLMILRRPNEAVVQAQVGLKLDPLSPLILSLYGTVMMNEGDYESAIAHFEKALSINPGFSFATGNQQRTCLLAGEYDKWFPLWKEIVCWDDSIITSFGNVLRQEGFVPAVEELFRLNEEFGTENCHLNDHNKFDWYMALNDYDKAMDYLERLYEADFTQLHYAATDQFGYEQLKSYPRYVEILRKLNLPLPED